MNGNGKEHNNMHKIKVPSCIKDGWFSEIEPMWPGQKLSLALEVSYYYNIQPVILEFVFINKHQQYFYLAGFFDRISSVQ